VDNIHTRRSCSQMIPTLLFWIGCLILLFVNPCSWLGPEFPFGTELCRLRVYNQSGKTLRVTPIYANSSISAVRLYRDTFPIIPAYQQRNITVKSGDPITLSYACSENGMPVLYACDPDGECYLHKSSYYLVYSMVVGYNFKSLESLPRPDAALEAAVQSFPERDATGIRYALLCGIGIVASIGGFTALARARTVEISKQDI
jgi:hypothetical protein